VLTLEIPRSHPFTTSSSATDTHVAWQQTSLLRAKALHALDEANGLAERQCELLGVIEQPDVPPLMAWMNHPCAARSIATRARVCNSDRRIKAVRTQKGEDSMKKAALLSAVTLFVAMVSLAEPPATTSHVMMLADAVTWGDAPPVLPKGAKFAVLSGDPSKDGIFVIRLKMPAGYRVAPHWHPTDEHVTVLDGTLAIGMGETLDEMKAKSLPAGGYALLPATMRHYAIATTAVTIQVSGMGPFVLNYVNSADDPSKK
jgi:quercetin dioxygenase-like cupin family protein